MTISRPTTRAQCVNGPRPCPYVGCRYHLLLDIGHGGTLRLLGTCNSLSSDEAALERLGKMPETCALDVADRGPHTLQDVGDLCNCTRERARQMEDEGLSRLRRSGWAVRLRPIHDALVAGRKQRLDMGELTQLWADDWYDDEEAA